MLLCSVLRHMRQGLPLPERQSGDVSPFSLTWWLLARATHHATQRFQAMLEISGASAGAAGAALASAAAAAAEEEEADDEAAGGREEGAAASLGGGPRVLPEHLRILPGAGGVLVSARGACGKEVEKLGRRAAGAAGAPAHPAWGGWRAGECAGRVGRAVWQWSQGCAHGSNGGPVHGQLRFGGGGVKPAASP